MRMSDWSSDVCSSDLLDHDIDENLEQRAYVIARQVRAALAFLHEQSQLLERQLGRVRMYRRYRTGMTAVDVAQIEERRPVAQLLEQDAIGPHAQGAFQQLRSEEHTSELQSLMRISYAVFCLKKK